MDPKALQRLQEACEQAKKDLPQATNGRWRQGKT
jgi:hypothetical protein